MRTLLFMIILCASNILAQPNITFKLSVSPNPTYVDGPIFVTFDFYNYSGTDTIVDLSLDLNDQLSWNTTSAPYSIGWVCAETFNITYTSGTGTDDIVTFTNLLIKDGYSSITLKSKSPSCENSYSLQATLSDTGSLWDILSDFDTLTIAKDITPLVVINPGSFELYTPISVTNSPICCGGGGNATINNSGLSGIGINAKHDNPSGANEAYLRQDGATSGFLSYNFNGENMNGVTLWNVDIPYAGGDASAREFQIIITHNTGIDTLNNYVVADDSAAQFIGFNQTHNGVSNIRINVLNTWLDCYENRTKFVSTTDQIYGNYTWAFGEFKGAFFDNSFRGLISKYDYFDNNTSVYLSDTSGVSSIHWYLYQNGDFTNLVSDTVGFELISQYNNIGIDTIFLKAMLTLNCITDSILDTVILIPDTTVAPNFGNDTSICFGDTIILDGGYGYQSYLWNNGQTSRLDTVVSSEGYSCTSSRLSKNLIINGDFESGVFGFSSNYANSCTSGAGTYCVTDNPQNHLAGFAPCDEPSGSGGNMMSVNGATTLNESFWCQTVDVLPNTDYQFSTWLASVNPNSPAILQFSIDGTNLGGTFNATSINCDWKQFYEVWNSGSNTSIEICIVNQNSAAVGNDFAIDDIYFAAVCTDYDSIYVEVKDSIIIPSIKTQNTCFEDQTIFELIDSSSVISQNWEIAHESAPSTIVYSSLQIKDTIQFSQSGKFYVTVYLDLDCKLDTLHDSINISQVNPIDLGNDTVLCVNDSILLDAGAGYDFYLWNDGDTSRFKMIDSSGQYSVKASKIADNLIFNGDFEQGSIGFTTDYNDISPSSSPGGAGQLTISDNGPWYCSDITTGSGFELIADGFSTQNHKIWCQVVSTSPNTDYIFSAWMSNTLNNASQMVVEFQINNNTLDAPFSINSSNCNWGEFYNLWNSGINTTSEICIIDQGNAGFGDDFVIDDIYFAPLCSKTDTINITIQTDSIKLNCLASDLKCNGDNSGSIEINPTGSSGTGYQYQIDTDAFQDSSSTYSDLAANTYAITVTDDAGCTNDTSITLAEPLALSLNTISTKDTRCFDLCDGEILLSSSGGSSPFVFTIDASISSSGTDSLFNGLCDGSYLAAVVDSNLCIDSFSIVINEPTELSISSSVIDTCVDNAVNISINASGGTPIYDYLWNGTSLSSSENVIVSSDSIISVYLIDDSLCHSDTIDISINKSPTLDLIVDSISCNGLSDGSILVTPTGGGSTYQYSVDASAFTSSNSIGGLSAGNHTLSVTDERSCIVDTTFQVFEPLPLVASIANQLNALCKDSCDGEVELTSSGGVSPISFTLDGNTPDINPATFNRLCDGTYSAVATDDNGCQNTISVVITEPNALTVSFPSDTCLLLPTGLVVTGSGGTISSDYTYIWNQNNNITGNGINAWSNQLDTVYSVFIIDDNLCVSPSIDIDVHIVPTIDYILTNDTIVTYGDQLELVALGGYQYSWSPSDVLDNPTDSKPIASPSETTTFQLNIVVGQCVTTDTVLVTVIQGDLFIPNIFSPDGDGFNDIFRIRGAIFDEFEMNIFNRWGEKVFDSKDQFEGWDGTFRNQDAQEGVYGFIIIGKTNQGNEVKEKGNITLMR